MAGDTGRRRCSELPSTFQHEFLSYWLKSGQIWLLDKIKSKPEVQLIVRVRAINYSYETLTLLWFILKYAEMFISMPSFIIVCSFIRGTNLLSLSSWLSVIIFLFTVFGKVLRYLPFTSVSYLIYRRLFSAWWESDLLDFSLFLQASYL